MAEAIRWEEWQAALDAARGPQIDGPRADEIREQFKLKAWQFKELIKHLKATGGVVVGRKYFDGLGWRTVYHLRNPAAPLAVPISAGCSEMNRSDTRIPVRLTRSCARLTRKSQKRSAA